MRIDVITLFPSLYPGPLGESIPGRALEQGLATLQAHDLREWGLGRHRSVDDYPYGGGAGMVLRVEPVVVRARGGRSAGHRRHADPARSRRDAVRPGGRAPTSPGSGISCSSARATRASTSASARYVDLELSVGDYVVSGGDLPAMVVIDAVLRLLPGAIDPLSAEEESFSDGLLEYPQYTRPPEFRGAGVPDVLVSGHHGEVARWRAERSLERTRRVRPDLLVDRDASGEPGGSSGSGGAGPG